MTAYRYESDIVIQRIGYGGGRPIETKSNIPKGYKRKKSMNSLDTSHHQNKNGKKSDMYLDKVCKIASYLVGEDKKCSESCPFNSCSEFIRKDLMIEDLNIYRDSKVMEIPDIAEKYSVTADKVWLSLKRAKLFFNFDMINNFGGL